MHDSERRPRIFPGQVATLGGRGGDTAGPAGRTVTQRRREA